MLSRVADSLYWMSRYLERAEHTVRMLDVNFNMTLDPSSTSEDVRWRRLLLALGHPADRWSGDSHALLQTLTHDEADGASVKACIAVARENARQVREEISSEQWLQLNRLYHLVTDYRQLEDGAQPEEYLAAVLDGLHLFQGVTDTTMSHGEGWQFIQVGRSIERASSIASLLSVYEFGAHIPPSEHQERLAGSHQFLEWIGLLRCCTAFEAYCNVYTADLTESQILEFLLLNKDFPHSISGRLQAALHFVEISDVLQGGVSDYLANIAQECRRVHTLLYRDYIHYSVQTALAM